MSLPVFTAALDSSPNYMRLVRILADGYAPFSTYRILEKGHNLDCNYILIIDAKSVH
jgi:hypothetical protein